MAAPGNAVVDILYRARCPRPDCKWRGEPRTDSAEAHSDRRLHDLGHITSDIRKGGGKR